MGPRASGKERLCSSTHLQYIYTAHLGFSENISPSKIFIKEETRKQKEEIRDKEYSEVVYKVLTLVTDIPPTGTGAAGFPL